MTDPSPEQSPEPSGMPRWVPVLIGAILVAMAALAVYTGLRSRDEGTILAHVRPQRQQQAEILEDDEETLVTDEGPAVIDESAQAESDDGSQPQS